MSLFYDAEAVYPHEGYSSDAILLPLAPEGAWSPTLDVLSTKHNLREKISEVLDRRGDLVSGATGARVFDDHAGLALPSRTFQWTAFDRAACNALLAFLDARRGRLVPFWAPTCQSDLSLACDVLSSTASLLLRASGYTDYLWPQASRHYIVIWAPGGGILRKITSAVVVDAATERIGIDQETYVPLAASTVISFLTLCRMAQDTSTLTWFSPWGCEASLNFVELPHEVTA